MQTRQLDEVLIVDDCSTDKTVEIIKKYIQRYCLNTWRLLINQVNKGWCKNFIDAFSMVKADIIFPCDQDDIWNLNKVEKMSAIMEQNSNINVLVSNFDVLNMSECKTIPGVYKMINDGRVTPIAYNSRYMTIRRPGCVYCFRSKLCKDIREMWTEGQAHDSILWRLGLFTESLYLYRESTIKWRRTDSSATVGKRNDWKTARQEYEGWIIQNQYLLKNVLNNDDNNRSLKEKNAQKCINVAQIVFRMHRKRTILDILKIVQYSDVLASWRTVFKIILKSSGWRKEDE